MMPLVRAGKAFALATAAFDEKHAEVEERIFKK